MISGFSGSPAPMSSRMQSRSRCAARFSWISMRHTVGGAHIVVTRQRSSTAEHRLGVEARVVVDEHAGAGVPGCEEAAPRVLGPTGRRDVEVHVPGLQADPVHRRQVADRIALVGVQNELGLGRRAGREVQQQRVGRAGLSVRGEIDARPASSRRSSASRWPPRRRTRGCSCPRGRRTSRHSPRRRSRASRRPGSCGRAGRPA